MVRAEDSEAHRITSPLATQLARGISCHFAMGGPIFPSHVYSSLLCNHTALLSNIKLINRQTFKKKKSYLQIKTFVTAQNLKKENWILPHPLQKSHRDFSWLVTVATIDAREHPVAVQCNCKLNAMWSFMAIMFSPVSFRCTVLLISISICVVLALLAGWFLENYIGQQKSE